MEKPECGAGADDAREAELARAYDAARDETRWIKRGLGDWLAVRLQIARGRQIGRVAAEFGISRSIIGDKRTRENWGPASPDEMEAWAEDVAIAGLMRADYLKKPRNKAEIARAAMHTPVEESGSAARTGTTGGNTTHKDATGDDGHDGLYDPLNSDRAARERTLRDIDELLTRLGLITAEPGSVGADVAGSLDGGGLDGCDRAAGAGVLADVEEQGAGSAERALADLAADGWTWRWEDAGGGGVDAGAGGEGLPACGAGGADAERCAGGDDRGAERVARGGDAA